LPHECRDLDQLKSEGVCVSVCEGGFSSMGGRGPDGSGIKGTSVNNICLFPCLISGITTVNACIVLDYKSTEDV